MNVHFARRFYEVSLDEKEWWLSLKQVIERKTGLPFDQFRINHG